MTKQQIPQLIGVGHAGLSARDPAATAEFYRDVLGLEVVGTSQAGTPLGAAAFLSAHPDRLSIDLALFANPAIQHTAFAVESLADLRAFRERVIAAGVPIKMALNHGVSLSLYFEDPEGHVLEIYWPTGVACAPIHGDPVDLTRSDTELRQAISELAARAGPPLVGAHASA
jgi:catechol-2,3-dioxygenase